MYDVQYKALYWQAFDRLYEKENKKIEEKYQARIGLLENEEEDNEFDDDLTREEALVMRRARLDRNFKQQIKPIAERYVRQQIKNRMLDEGLQREIQERTHERIKPIVEEKLQAKAKEALEIEAEKNR